MATCPEENHKILSSSFMVRRRGATLAGAVSALMVTALILASSAQAAETGAEWGSHNGGNNYVVPLSDDTSMARSGHLIRRAWQTALYTGYIKGGSGSAMSALEAGLEPAYGEAASPLVSDGVLVVSWSRPSGTISAPPDSINHRYFKDDAVNARLADTYFRIDADWMSAGLDAETGEILWQKEEPSASLNFLSNKRDHNGISGAAGGGIYVTTSILGHVFAYDIKTGERRWHTTLTGWNERAQAAKDEFLANRRLPYLSDGPFGHKRSGGIIIDSVVVLPDLNGGLVGLDSDDGSQLWQLADSLGDKATPRPWRDTDGSVYLVCNNAQKNSGDILMVNPRDGSVLWRFATGTNPGELVMGNNHLLLHPKRSTKPPALLRCYSVSSEGLTEDWAFTDVKAHGIELKADFGAHRKGVFRGDYLYLMVGTSRAKRLASFDPADGREIQRDDQRLGTNVGEPVIVGDMLYLQTNSAHSGGKAGLMLYQLDDQGGFTFLDEMRYKGVGVHMATSYQYPIATPVVNGIMYIRGKTHMNAVDLRAVTTPMADVTVADIWAGFHRPLQAVMIADAHSIVQSMRMEMPPRLEMGVVGTPVRRSDIWIPIAVAEGLEIGGASESQAEIAFGGTAWQATISMQAAEGDRWHGRWQRHITGWEQTEQRDGTFDGSSRGGFQQRGWQTPWIKDKPYTVFSPLPEGHERVLLNLFGCIPRADGHKNLTLALDHNGSKVIAGVGGGFSFNQAYHELDVSTLEVDDQGIRGSALLIINSDAWVPGDHRNGDSLAGTLTLDIRFGERAEDGTHPVSGSWSVEWGQAVTRSGPIEAIISQNR